MGATSNSIQYKPELYQQLTPYNLQKSTNQFRLYQLRKQPIYLKEKIGDFKQNQQSQKEQLSKLSSINQKSLQRIFCTRLNKQQKICSNSMKIYHYIQYYPKNLKNVIQNRTTKNICFSQDQIFQIVTDITNACYQLQIKQLYHPRIVPQNILISVQGKYILQVQEIIYQNTDPHLRKFYSPQDTDFQINNIYKSAVFSLGMTLLECMTLLDCSVLFYKNRQLKKGVFQQFLITQQKSMSKNLYQTILKMVATNNNERADFKFLKRFLQLMQLQSSKQHKQTKTINQISSSKSNKQNRCIQGNSTLRTQQQNKRKLQKQSDICSSII